MNEYQSLILRFISKSGSGLANMRTIPSPATGSLRYGHPAHLLTAYQTGPGATQLLHMHMHMHR
uniref:Uncharacterized protein api62 n=1 Tax=Yersinia pseudotuberculosis TaxID=633 RepID=Q6EVY4_YERPU|nr:hypothetical protein [Yersinia pseudotuberculosis]